MIKNKLYMNGVIAGNFDVIHPGYIHMFTEMKKVCENVIVEINNVAIKNNAGIINHPYPNVVNIP